jgi:hypothetical protein
MSDKPLVRRRASNGAMFIRMDYADDSITVSDLRTRWEWDPLRNDPRFQKILAGSEPKTILK